MGDAQSVLHKLRQKNPDITAAVLATNDGLAVHTDSCGAVDADTLAAMAADIAVRASHMAEDVQQGKAQQVLIQNDAGHVVAARVGEELYLVVTAKPDASLGLLLISVRKAAGEISPDIM